MSSYSPHTDTVFSAYLPPFNSENRAVVFVIYDKLFGLVPYMCCYQRYQHYSYPHFTGAETEEGSHLPGVTQRACAEASSQHRAVVPAAWSLCSHRRNVISGVISWYGWQERAVSKQADNIMLSKFHCPALQCTHATVGNTSLGTAGLAASVSAPVK